MRVLLADDDEWVREATVALLAFCGHDVVVAEDGEKALEAFRRWTRDAAATIDAVILDMRMPRLSGPEVLAALRKLAPDLPVLLFSGYERYQLDPALFADPNVGYLAKPMELDAFNAGLRALGVAAAG
jgi:CheY-like chemotaxis protein